MTQFSDFGLGPEILSALDKMKFTEPTPIQAKAIPLIQENHDLIALAETGSGKTAACAIPICDRIDVERKVIQALILVPTRELALQYATETQKVGVRKGVQVMSVLGGDSYELQKAKINNGVHVCVATPGRLIDFIYSRDIDLSEVETLILDEADEMLSMGFYDDLDFIMQCLVHEHQTLLFSATMPKQIKKIAQGHMKEPREVQLNVEQRSPAKIDHRFVFCPTQQKPQRLKDLLDEMKPKQSIIFCESRIEVEKVCRELRKTSSAVDYLHAGLSQDARTIVTSKFRSGRIRHMVATDVAARGLDFSGVTHVFIYQLPRDPEVYVHRSGRTGRSGRSGTAISLVSKGDLRTLDRISKLMKQKPEWIGKGPQMSARPEKQEGNGSKRPRRRYRPRKKD